MAITDKRHNGRNTYRTDAAKFLYGGRLDNMFKASNKIVNGMEDPSFFAFNFGIHPSTTGLFAIETGMKTMEYDLNIDRNYGVLTYMKNAISPNTALSTNATGESIEQADLSNMYMKDAAGNLVPNPAAKGLNITFSKEYENMKKFVHGFEEITKNHPYMMQSVEGLQDAYKKFYNSHKESYLGGGTDTKLKITCLESLDLRMSALFDSYFRAVYNHTYRRMNIPRNLLRFDCWVLVHDLRNIRTDNATLLSALNGEPVTERIVNNLSTILFNFKNCMFDIDEIGTMLETVNNAEANQTKFSFNIIYNDVDIRVNSLADILEAKEEQESTLSEPYRQYYDLLDVHSLNDELNSLNLSGLMANIGSSIFNYATQGSSMGNIYDDSWAGILSSMMSSISNVGVSSILNSAMGKGMGILKSKTNEVMEKMHGWAEKEEPVSYSSTTGVARAPRPVKPQNSGIGNENVYGETNHEPVAFSGENVYSNVHVQEPEQMVNENIYTDAPNAHEALVEDNVYDILPETPAPDFNESVLTPPAPAEPFTGGMADMSSNSTHENLQGGQVFNPPAPAEPYLGEDADMSSNATHEDIEPVKVFEAPPEVLQPDSLGTVYTFTSTSVTKAESIPDVEIPTNVYDRVIESVSKAIPIEKIFIAPKEHKKMKNEKTSTPIRETKESSMEQMNVYAENAKEQITIFLQQLGIKNIVFMD